MYHSLAPHLKGAMLIGMTMASVADVFVDANGTGCAGGNGSAAFPVCSITQALQIASPGDTIRISPGTYFENLTFGFDLTLVGTGGAEVTIVDGMNLGRTMRVTPFANVILDGLTLTNGASVHGAGLTVEGDLTLRNSTIRGNCAELAGGGISMIDGTSPSLSIENSTLRDNCCSSANGWGGGIVATRGALTISATTLSNNRSGDWIGPQPGGSGGALFLDSCAFELSNSTISSNQARTGAGIYCRRPLVGSVLSNLTIAGNQAAMGPGGVDVIGGILQVRNSLLVGNSGFPGYADAHGSFASLGHNIVGDVGTGTTGFVHGANGDLVGSPGSHVSALLAPLQDNGGPSFTHALLPGSPAIDAGDPNFGEPTDQRGVARPLGATSDIGAYEFDPALNSLCHGDGGVQLGCTNCPCGNNSIPGTLGGCLNGTGRSAWLGWGGDKSVSLPPSSTHDLRFSLEGAPPLAVCLLLSGDNIAPTSANSPCFGLPVGAQSSILDGLRCVVGDLLRHGGRSVDQDGEVGAAEGANSPWGGEGPPAVGVAQVPGGFLAGETRYFQVLYREDPLAVCGRGLNTSQAIAVTFEP